MFEQIKLKEREVFKDPKKRKQQIERTSVIKADFNNKFDENKPKIILKLRRK